jgi:glutamate/tyrosine decarboxylase-like PLP-dependent enzyme
MYPQVSELSPALAAAHAKAEAFLAHLDSRPPAIPFDPLPPLGLEDAGLGATGAIELLWKRYGSAFSATTGPRYWGYVQGGVTPAALAADWICPAIDQTGQMHGDSPAVAIEQETIGMLRQLFSLPPSHQGIFVSGGSMANFAGLATGLQRLGAMRGIDISRSGVRAVGPVHLLTGECHACVPRACGLLGLGRDCVEYLPRAHGRERVDVKALEKRLKELRGAPVILVGNIGTVTTGDFDDLVALADLAEEFGAHLHIDGASGLFATVSPKLRHLTNGIERADTIAGDAHKWLNVPYDSGLLFSRHLEHQLEMFKNVSPYLPSPSLNPLNIPNLGPENSRRLRALPAWASLQAYGRDGYREIVERSTAHAQTLGELIQAEQGFRLLAPVFFNVLCFELTEGGKPLDAELTRAFVDRLIDDGRVRVNHSTFDGQPCIRLAILNWRTTADDITIAMDAFRACRAALSR